ncbi:carboxymuconolactone decarboxylase [Actinosynnema sp. ALI-1.44]|uniref:carboxymuconolactone decarboxylase family protein n=1 Tax=Actinosynnema sp. ALI-1.44 TaxID=1933779 RepID=UPI00097C480C|nr:carboxymuconolactone decarboxylase family protein [Actinosynnema sp. ALI-1.44]ONI76378.1 carboxymuconolactone decarboxylase [Actinosynnema sp. ALI-1.44]
MPHIKLDSESPGIIGLFEYRPETAKPLGELADVLLRGPSTLSRGERELIATVVSDGNECEFCASAHGAFAAAQLDGGLPLVRAATDDYRNAPISDKLKALLAIALLVRQGGRAVDAASVAAAKDAGATDLEIHDTVLIAAAFCMFNRYVDGLATETPASDEAYAARAQQIVEHGYAKT